ncbi:MAG TPA: phosphatidate cytidylyltransferase [Bordetella sp.]
MLGQRIITAVVLLIVLAAAIAAPQPVWMLALLSLAAACACWEWLRLTLPARVPAAVPRVIGIVVFAFLLALSWVWSAPTGGVLPEELLAFGVLVVIVSLIWLIPAVIAVVRGRSDAPPASVGWSAFAVLATVTAWAVLTVMYLAFGPLYVLTLLALVWAADICAYFGGRKFGRRKLAPRVSPGKTVEGALSGLVGAVVVTLVGAWWPDTFGYMLVDRWSIWGAILIAAFLGAVSIMGDLFESLLKRRAGVKDSSGLLPGHGGVYDRLDAILPVVPIALLVSGALF